MRYLLAPALVLIGCNSPAPLPQYGSVPGFQLTNQSGAAFDSKDLNGRIWVADFIYTSCGSICPRMSSQMRQIQDALTGAGDIKLVSFTVDPARDTPAQLAKYAREHHANEVVWYFLTGPPETLQGLNRDAFKLGNVDGSLEHSSRFVLVDRHARIRGYYDTSEPDSIPRLVSDIKTLLNHES